MADNPRKKCSYGFLRILGILGICIMHYRVLCVGEIFHSSILGINVLNFVALYGGSLVPFFFMLSGYCITVKYFSSPFEGFSDFLKQRCNNLIPAAIVSTIIMAVLQWSYFIFFGEWWTGREATIYNVIGNLLGLQSFLPKQFMDTVNGPTWYIYSLILCYIVFAVYKKKTNNSVLFWIMCAFACMGSEIYKIDLPLLHADTFRALLPFSLGCILAMKTDTYSKSLRIWKYLFSITVIVIILLLLGRMKIVGDFEKVLLLSFYPLLILTATLIGQSSLFEVSYIDWIEKYFRKISFYIYLYNLPCLIFLSMINKYLNLYFGSLKVFCLFLVINVGVGMVASIFAESKVFAHLKQECICLCDNFLGRGIE